MTNESVPQRACSVANCKSTIRVYANPQYCLSHWRRWKRYGDPTQFYNSFGDTPAERFWSQVALTADDSRCWLWTGKVQRKGYPRRKYAGGMYLGHHIAWHLTYGRFPQGEVLRHKCDNPRCVNPKHLVEGTSLQNVEDRQLRNRQAKGSRIACARLKESDIPFIRKALAEGIEMPIIAKQFNVGPTAIHSIKRGITWSHVPDPENYSAKYVFSKHYRGMSLQP